MRTRFAIIISILSVALFLPSASVAGFKIFAGAAYIAPLADPTDVSGIGNAIEASTSLGGTAGFEWRFAENRFALELDGTWATTDVDSSTGTLGDVDFQPLTGNFNFHFFPDKFFDLYVGAGYAYVNVDDVNLSAGGSVAMDSGTAWDAQVCVDLNLGDHFAIVLGIRYYALDLESSGGGGEVAVDPLISRLGVGWRW